MPEIFVDGSRNYQHKKPRLGFGVRVETNEAVERYGYRQLSSLNDPIAHLHEHVALVEGVLTAVALGLKPQQCTFISDNIQFKEALVGTVRVGQRAAYLRSMIKLKAIYGNSIYAVLVFLQQATIKHEHGHRDCIGNRRVDHLAGVALRGERKAPYDDWIQKPWSRYDKDGKNRSMNAPFALTTNEQLAERYALSV